jgi:hypothetical protein
MDGELQAFEANQTWDLVSCPSDVSMIGSK